MAVTGADVPVGILGWGVYRPERSESAALVAGFCGRVAPGASMW